MPRQGKKQSSTDVPIGLTSKTPAIAKRNLEDCEPGATRGEVLDFIEKVAKSPKFFRKRGEPPAPAS